MKKRELAMHLSQATPCDAYLLNMLDNFRKLPLTDLFPRDESSICAVFHNLAHTVGHRRDSIHSLFGGRSNDVSRVSQVPGRTAGHELGFAGWTDSSHAIHGVMSSGRNFARRFGHFALAGLQGGRHLACSVVSDDVIAGGLEGVVQSGLDSFVNYVLSTSRDGIQGSLRVIIRRRGRAGLASKARYALSVIGPEERIRCSLCSTSSSPKQSLVLVISDQLGLVRMDVQVDQMGEICT